MIRHFFYISINISDAIADMVYKLCNQKTGVQVQSCLSNAPSAASPTRPWKASGPKKNGIFFMQRMRDQAQNHAIEKPSREKYHHCRLSGGWFGRGCLCGRSGSRAVSQGENRLRYRQAPAASAGGLPSDGKKRPSLTRKTISSASTMRKSHMKYAKNGISPNPSPRPSDSITGRPARTDTYWPTSSPWPTTRQK